MSKAQVGNVQIHKYKNGQVFKEEDIVVSEEPLEIRLKFLEHNEPIEKRISVTMRTPGNDFELVIGFLFTEGILPNYKVVKNIRYCEQITSEEERDNVVIVELNPGFDPDLEKLQRNFYTTSSCGVCGKTSIEAVHVQCAPIPKNSIELDRELIASVPDKVQDVQTVYKHTGGIHAAAIIDESGEVLIMREDIGRHNAVDKVIGAAMKEKMELSTKWLFVSGRAGFELVQKVGVAGIPVMIAVGAPSTLSVQLADTLGIRLIGFTSAHRFNVYSQLEPTQ